MIVVESVEITAKVQFEAFEVPSQVAVIPYEEDDKADGFCLMSIRYVDRSVVDQLAKRWLNALYAGRGEASPFKLSEVDAQ